MHFRGTRPARLWSGRVANLTVFVHFRGLENRFGNILGKKEVIDFDILDRRLLFGQSFSSSHHLSMSFEILEFQVKSPKNISQKVRNFQDSKIRSISQTEKDYHWNLKTRWNTKESKWFDRKRFFSAEISTSAIHLVVLCKTKLVLNHGWKLNNFQNFET